MSVNNALNGSAGKGQTNEGISLGSFLASVSAAALVFGVEFLLFVAIKNKFTRIYQPRTYLVPEKERTTAPPVGLLSWVSPVFKTSNSDFIQKCGLDAYFFLRYLRTLLKIFIPLALIILPILLPLNEIGGRGSHFAVGRYANATNVTGLDQLAWGNVRPTNTDRYWAHLVLAVFVVVYVCFIFYDELRGYIRLRQAYLTSPQHRLRASATTVLVTAIPRKWLTIEALDGLYDVFPGGIRNIWINRNFDELSDKVQLRNKLALDMEAGETELIKLAKKAHMKKLEKEEKKAGAKKTKAEKEQRKKDDDAAAARTAEGSGTSSGDPHQVRHSLFQIFSNEEESKSPERNKGMAAIPIVGQGIETVGQGFNKLTTTVFGGIKKASRDVDDRLNTTGGLVVDEDDDFNSPSGGASGDRPGLANSYGTASQRRDPFPGDAGYRPTDGAADETDVHPALRTRSDESTVRVSASNDSPPRNRDHLTVPGQGDGAGNARQDATKLDHRADKEGSSQDQTESSGSEKPRKSWMYWINGKKHMTDKVPSPNPTLKPLPKKPGRDDDRQRPGDAQTATKDKQTNEGTEKERKTSKSWNPFKSEEKKPAEYPAAFNDDFDENDDGEPLWKKYIKPKDRPTMRLPIFGWQWMPSIPLIGKKVDTIYYCRKEVARLNVEIEQDQQNPEDFPLMNSAFVQFNHQVAAHMACQSVSHHVPKQMAPRIVEISPDDVLWDNMSVKWWERYLRTAAVILVVVGLIIGWAFPVTFTGLLSQLKYLAGLEPWLGWINRLPSWFLSLVQGVLPQVMLGILMAVLPMILRFLAKQSGVQTGMGIELTVQNYYFAFLFVQIFLVVSISSGITSVIHQLSDNIGSAPALLATNLPKASNYFFSYMILQAFSVSAGALVQIGGLISWFILAPLLDNTARQKWARQTDLPQMRWGTFFPVYTNLAAIGLIYSVVSPLILVFNIVTFGLFWIVYRYNTLYVTKFRFDTGGLLFPKAINQLFTGLYVMEICLIGLFFLVRNEDNDVACQGQAIVMIVVLVVTVLFQYLMNEAFGPLLRYLPITLEDEAVERDEEFAKAQRKRLNLVDEDEEGDDIQDVLEEREERERAQDRAAEDIEMREIEARKRNKLDPRSLGSGLKVSWADRSRNMRRSKDFGHYPKRQKDDHTTSQDHIHRRERDIESQRQNPIGEALFSGINDEIEDLTPEERDKLIQRAFQHEALRAKRPVIWIPRDTHGVSDDEIYRTQRFSKQIWISNEYTGLDSKGRVVYRRSPPDFSEVDLIEL